jgi:hypothetical protein
MDVPIKRSSVVTQLIRPLESSQLSRKLNGEDVVKLNFNRPAAIDLQIGDYIELFDKRYTLNLLPNVVKKSSFEYSYECIFESPLYDLRKVQFMNGYTGEFFLNGDLTQFVQLLVTNLNRIYTGWTVGTVDTGTTVKNLQFSNENSLVVLQRLCTEYNVDFKIVNKAISVGTFEQSPVHEFAYGKGKGLYQLTRKVVDSKDVITRLYPYGSTRNIPANYRNYSTRLKIAENYIESNVNKYGIIEQSYNFDDIYPRFTGSITSVTDEKTFRCTAINFDVNAQLMSGLSAKIHFNSGALQGYEFEMVSYNATTKEVVVKALDQEKSINNAGILESYILPNSTIKPAIGDSFVFIDISMSDAYITAAESELLTKAQEYLNQNNEPRVVYEMDIDPIYMKQNAIALDVGVYVNVIDDPLGIDKDTRITNLTRSLYNEYMWKVDLADQLSPQRIDRAVADLEEIKRLVVINRLDDIPRAYRNWRNTTELLSSIFDPEGYFDTDKIKPLSIETSMLAVGAKSGQFTMNCLLEANYGANANSCKLGAGLLVHFSIEETPRTWTISENILTSLTPNSYYYIYARCSKSTANSGTLVLDTVQRKMDSDPTNYYFLVGILHSVVSSVRGISLTYGQTAINGRFIKTGRIQNADGSTYFDLDTGDIQGKITFRSGKTDTQIETDIGTVQSDAYSASEVSNLALSESDQALIDAANAQTAANNAQTAANTANAAITDMASDDKITPSEKSLLKKEFDAIESEYLKIYYQAEAFSVTHTVYDNAYTALYSYIGSNLNTLTDTWNLGTNGGSTLRAKFQGYTDARTDLLNAIATKAKTLADAAQTTANTANTLAGAKNRNFNITPFTPYNVGDTWTNGTDLYTCVTTRLTGSYSAGDWAKRVNYDSTQVTIDNGIVSAGSFRVKDSNNVEWGGMRGATGTTGGEVGIWLGSSMANRNNAPLRLYHDGRGFLAGWEIAKDTGNNWYYFAMDTGTDATSAGMSPNDYPFYAGATYADRANAKAWIKPTGEAYFEKITLKTGSTGKRMVLDSSNANFILYGSTDSYYLKIDTSGTNNPSIIMVGAAGGFNYIDPQTINMYTGGINQFRVITTDTYLDVLMKGLPTRSDIDNNADHWHPLYVHYSTKQIAYG